jgi:hypothetical protein
VKRARPLTRDRALVKLLRAELRAVGRALRDIYVCNAEELPRVADDREHANECWHCMGLGLLALARRRRA